MLSIFISSLLTLTAVAAPAPKAQISGQSGLAGLGSLSSLSDLSSLLGSLGDINSFLGSLGDLSSFLGSLGLGGGTGSANLTSVLGGGSILSSGLDIGGLLGTTSLAGGSTTSSDIEDGACKNVSFIFARGTTEPGNMGSTVGPSLAAKLKSVVGEDAVAVQGVEYPADIVGAVGGSLSPKSAAGATNMAELVNQAISQCPTTQVVLAGYSQGAQQVHGALMNLDDTSKIAAVVTFGDPLSSQKFENIDSDKTKIYCASGDAVCANTPIITLAHLSYALEYTDPATEFIESELPT